MFTKKQLQEAKTQAETEAKKNREQYMTQEKASREKWEKQKLREIKEETTKGLEPEINKLIGVLFLQISVPRAAETKK